MRSSQQFRGALFFWAAPASIDYKIYSIFRWRPPFQPLKRTSHTPFPAIFSIDSLATSFLVRIFRSCLAVSSTDLRSCAYTFHTLYRSRPFPERA